MTAAPSAPGPPAPALERRQVAVVDTNVWLDLHYFRDADSQLLAAALDSAHWVAARCRETDAELQIVLRRPRFCASPTERSRLFECLRAWQARTPLVPLRAPAPCRCRDPHDQKFLDLAFAVRAAALLTKDKALLALKRRARRFGLAILTPREFGERAQALSVQHLQAYAPPT